MSDTEPTLDDVRRSATHVLLDHGDEAALDDAEIAVSRELEHHLGRVLRLADGAPVSVTDGAGRIAMATWSATSKSLHKVSAVATENRPAPLTVATAIPKGDRVDVLVQKTVELGVGRLVLLHAERSVVRWKQERADKQRIRLQRIADEAVRQSRRSWRVRVDGPVSAESVLGDAVIAEPNGPRLSGSETMVAIGPEGGWTDDEIAAAHGVIGLGPGILRVETAAIAVCALRMANSH